MKDLRQFYINGQWVNPVQANDLHVENPATQEMVATISMGAAADVEMRGCCGQGCIPCVFKFQRR